MDFKFGILSVISVVVLLQDIAALRYKNTNFSQWVNLGLLRYFSNNFLIDVSELMTMAQRGTHYVFFRSNTVALFTLNAQI